MLATIEWTGRMEAETFNRSSVSAAWVFLPVFCMTSADVRTNKRVMRIRKGRKSVVNQVEKG
jgi:hypothetical protein